MRATSLAVAAALAAALAFGAVTGLCLVGDAILMRHALSPKLLTALALFAAGAAMAHLVADPLARIVARRRGASARLAAMLALLMVGTAGFSAIFLFLQIRVYYSPYYPAEATLEWVYHFLYTAASAAYQVSVIGLRYFLPFGLVPLFAAAFMFAARTDRRL